MPAKQRIPIKRYTSIPSLQSRLSDHPEAIMLTRPSLLIGHTTARPTAITMTPYDVLHLQRMLGNRATVRALRAEKQHQTHNLNDTSTTENHRATTTDTLQTAPTALIQRIKYKEFVERNRNYTDILHKWLDQRCPGSTGQFTIEKQYLLSGFNEDELKAILSQFENRMMWDDFSPLVQEDQIEEYLSQSAAVGAFVSKICKERSITNNVQFLKDSEFQLTYTKIALQNNQHLSLKQEALTDYVARRIDLIDGFTHEGTIYVRTNILADEHILIHESIHFFGHAAFEKTFGHPMNEGMTELLAQEVSQEAGVTPKFFTYQREMALVDRIMRAAGIDKQTMITAYFTGDVEGIREAIVKTIGGQNTQVLADQHDVREAHSLLSAMLKPENDKQGATEWTNLQDENGQTALHHAVNDGNIKQVKTLLLQKVRPDLPDKHKCTPLLLACKQAKPKPEIVHLLIIAGANVGASDQNQSTPLHCVFAQNEPSISVLNQLLKAGADVNAIGHFERTPLHVGLEKGHGTIVIQLLGHANVFLEDANEETLLMIAARKKLSSTILTAIGKKHKTVSQNWLSIGSDVAVRIAPDEKANSTPLSKFSTAYLIKTTDAWYQIVYVGEGFSIAKCFIKKTEPVSIVG